MKKLRRVLGSVALLSNSAGDGSTKKLARSASTSARVGNPDSLNPTIVIGDHAISVGNVAGVGGASGGDVTEASYKSFKTSSLDSLDQLPGSKKQQLTYPEDFQEKSFSSKLHKAAYAGDLTKLRKHSKKVSAQVTDTNGRTPLHLAAAKGHVDVVRYLVNARVDVNMADSGGVTAFMQAVRAGHGDVALLLLQNGASPSIRDNDGYSGLHHTCLLPPSEGTDAIMDIILNPAEDQEDGATEQLIELANNAGRTALHFACLRGNLSACTKLVDGGSSVNCSDKEGTTPLMLAAQSGNVQLIDCLLNYSADAFLRDSRGRPAAEYAKLSDNDYAFQMLVKACDVGDGEYSGYGGGRDVTFSSLVQPNTKKRLIPSGLLGELSDDNRETDNDADVDEEATSSGDELPGERKKNITKRRSSRASFSADAIASVNEGRKDSKSKVNSNSDDDSWGDESDSAKDKPKVNLAKFLQPSSSDDEGSGSRKKETPGTPEGNLSPGPPKPPRLHSSNPSLFSMEDTDGNGSFTTKSKTSRTDTLFGSCDTVRQNSGTMKDEMVDIDSEIKERRVSELIKRDSSKSFDSSEGREKIERKESTSGSWNNPTESLSLKMFQDKSKLGIDDMIEESGLSSVCTSHYNQDISACNKSLVILGKGSFEQELESLEFHPSREPAGMFAEDKLADIQYESSQEISFSEGISGDILPFEKIQEKIPELYVKDGGETDLENTDIEDTIDKLNDSSGSQHSELGDETGKENNVGQIGALNKQEGEHNDEEEKENPEGKDKVIREKDIISKGNVKDEDENLSDARDTTKAQKDDNLSLKPVDLSPKPAEAGLERQMENSSCVDSQSSQDEEKAKVSNKVKSTFYDFDFSDEDTDSEENDSNKNTGSRRQERIALKVGMETLPRRGEEKSTEANGGELSSDADDARESKQHKDSIRKNEEKFGPNNDHNGRISDVDKTESNKDHNGGILDTDKTGSNNDHKGRLLDGEKTESNSNHISGILDVDKTEFNNDHQGGLLDGEKSESNSNYKGGILDADNTESNNDHKGVILGRENTESNNDRNGGTLGRRDTLQGAEEIWAANASIDRQDYENNTDFYDEEDSDGDNEIVAVDVRETDDTNILAPKLTEDSLRQEESACEVDVIGEFKPANKMKGTSSSKPSLEDSFESEVFSPILRTSSSNSSPGDLASPRALGASPILSQNSKEIKDQDEDLLADEEKNSRSSSARKTFGLMNDMFATFDNDLPVSKIDAEENAEFEFAEVIANSSIENDEEICSKQFRLDSQSENETKEEKMADLNSETLLRQDAPRNLKLERKNSISFGELFTENGQKFRRRSSVAALMKSPSCNRQSFDQTVRRSLSETNSGAQITKNSALLDALDISAAHQPSDTFNESTDAGSLGDGYSMSTDTDESQHFLTDGFDNLMEPLAQLEKVIELPESIQHLLREIRLQLKKEHARREGYNAQIKLLRKNQIRLTEFVKELEQKNLDLVNNFSKSTVEKQMLTFQKEGRSEDIIQYQNSVDKLNKTCQELKRNFKLLSFKDVQQSLELENFMVQLQIISDINKSLQERNIHPDSMSVPCQTALEVAEDACQTSPPEAKDRSTQVEDTPPPTSTATCQTNSVQTSSTVPSKPTSSSVSTETTRVDMVSETCQTSSSVEKSSPVSKPSYSSVSTETNVIEMVSETSQTSSITEKSRTESKPSSSSVFTSTSPVKVVSETCQTDPIIVTLTTETNPIHSSVSTQSSPKKLVSETSQTDFLDMNSKVKITQSSVLTQTIELPTPAEKNLTSTSVQTTAVLLESSSIQVDIDTLIRAEGEDFGSQTSRRNSLAELAVQTENEECTSCTTQTDSIGETEEEVIKFAENWSQTEQIFPPNIASFCEVKQTSNCIKMTQTNFVSTTDGHTQTKQIENVPTESQTNDVMTAEKTVQVNDQKEEPQPVSKENNYTQCSPIALRNAESQVVPITCVNDSTQVCPLLLKHVGVQSCSSPYFSSYARSPTSSKVKPSNVNVGLHACILKGFVENGTQTEISVDTGEVIKVLSAKNVHRLTSSPARKTLSLRKQLTSSLDSIDRRILTSTEELSQQVSMLNLSKDSIYMSFGDSRSQSPSLLNSSRSDDVVSVEEKIVSLATLVECDPVQSKAPPKILHFEDDQIEGASKMREPVFGGEELYGSMRLERILTKLQTVEEDALNRLVRASEAQQLLSSSQSQTRHLEVESLRESLDRVAYDIRQGLANVKRDVKTYMESKTDFKNDLSLLTQLVYDLKSNNSMQINDLSNSLLSKHSAGFKALEELIEFCVKQVKLCSKKDNNSEEIKAALDELKNSLDLKITNMESTMPHKIRCSVSSTIENEMDKIPEDLSNKIRCALEGDLKQVRNGEKELKCHLESIVEEIQEIKQSNMKFNEKLRTKTSNSQMHMSEAIEENFQILQQQIHDQQQGLLKKVSDLTGLLQKQEAFNQNTFEVARKISDIKDLVQEANSDKERMNQLAIENEQLRTELESERCSSHPTYRPSTSMSELHNRSASDLASENLLLASELAVEKQKCNLLEERVKNQSSELQKTFSFLYHQDPIVQLSSPAPGQEENETEAGERSDLNSLKLSKDLAETKFREQARELDELKMSNQSAENRIQDQMREIHDLKLTKDLIENKLRGLLNEFSELKNCKDQSEVKLRDQIRELNDLHGNRDVMENKVRSQIREINELSKEKEQAEARLRDQMRELNDLSANKDLLESKLRELEQKNVSLFNRIKFLDNTLTEENQNVSRLQHELSKVNALVISIREEKVEAVIDKSAFHQVAKKLERVTAEMTEKNFQLENLSDTLQQKDNLVRNRETQVNQLQWKLQSSLQSNSELQFELENLNSSLAKSEDNLRKKEQLLLQLRKTCDNLERELEDRDGILKEKDTKIEKLRKSNGEQQAALKQMQRNGENLTSQVRNKQHEIDELLLKIQDISREADLKNSAIKSSEEKVREISREHGKLLEETQRLRDERKSTELLTQEKGLANQLLDKCQSDYRSLQETISTDYVPKSSLSVYEQEMESKYQLKINQEVVKLDATLRKYISREKLLKERYESTEDNLREELKNLGQEVIRLNGKLNMKARKDDTWKQRHDHAMRLLRDQHAKAAKESFKSTRGSNSYEKKGSRKSISKQGQFKVESDEEVDLTDLKKRLSVPYKSSPFMESMNLPRIRRSSVPRFDKTLESLSNPGGGPSPAMDDDNSNAIDSRFYTYSKSMDRSIKKASDEVRSSLTDANYISGIDDYSNPFLSSYTTADSGVFEQASPASFSRGIGSPLLSSTLKNESRIRVHDSSADEYLDMLKRQYNF